MTAGALGRGKAGAGVSWLRAVARRVSAAALALSLLAAPAHALSLREAIDRLYDAGGTGDPEAIEVVRQAAEAGDLEARAIWGDALYNGLSVTADRARAVAILDEAAREGSPDAALTLGLIWKSDNAPFPPDPVSAARWLGIAAQGGPDWIDGIVREELAAMPREVVERAGVAHLLPPAPPPGDTIITGDPALVAAHQADTRPPPPAAVTTIPGGDTKALGGSDTRLRLGTFSFQQCIEAKLFVDLDPKASAAARDWVERYEREATGGCTTMPEPYATRVLGAPPKVAAAPASPNFHEGDFAPSFCARIYDRVFDAISNGGIGEAGDVATAWALEHELAVKRGQRFCTRVPTAFASAAEARAAPKPTAAERAVAPDRPKPIVRQAAPAPAPKPAFDLGGAIREKARQGRIEHQNRMDCFHRYGSFDC